jgi:hypothetical protein
MNLLVNSKINSFSIVSRFFATIKNLGVDIKPTDTLVFFLFTLS